MKPWEAEPLNWLEVSLEVNGELAEAVADVLARFAPNGVVIENGVYYQDPDDPGTSLDKVNVRAYLAVDGHLDENRLKLEQALWHLGSIQPLPEVRFTPIADQNWMEAWKENYHPIPIGERLVIVPAWLESPDARRIPICIDPGMAFGTGTHPTTQLCLEVLERYTPVSGDVIDLGCGSGILAIAALKLGASRALAVDIDPAAVEATLSNARINDLHTGLLTGQGSLDELLAGRFAFRQAPLVLANILANVLIGLLDKGLHHLVSPGGALVLSGILEEQAESVRAAAEAKGLRLIEQRQMGDWVALVVGRGKE